MVLVLVKATDAGQVHQPEEVPELMEGKRPVERGDVRPGREPTTNDVGEKREGGSGEGHAGDAFDLEAPR